MLIKMTQTLGDRMGKKVTLGQEPETYRCGKFSQDKENSKGMFENRVKWGNTEAKGRSRLWVKQTRWKAPRREPGFGPGSAVAAVAAVCNQRGSPAAPRVAVSGVSAVLQSLRTGKRR